MPIAYAKPPIQSRKDALIRIAQTRMQPVLGQRVIAMALLASAAGLLFSGKPANITSSFGDGVPLITAWTGLMTPADNNGRWGLMGQTGRRFFVTILRQLLQPRAVRESMHPTRTGGPNEPERCFEAIL